MEIIRFSKKVTTLIPELQKLADNDDRELKDYIEIIISRHVKSGGFILQSQQTELYDKDVWIKKTQLLDANNQIKELSSELDNEKELVKIVKKHNEDLTLYIQELEAKLRQAQLPGTSTSSVTRSSTGEDTEITDPRKSITPSSDTDFYKAQINSLNNVISKLEAEKKQMANQISQANEDIRKLLLEKSDPNTYILELKNKIIELVDVNDSLNQLLINANAEINELKQHINEFMSNDDSKVLATGNHLSEILPMNYEQQISNLTSQLSDLVKENHQLKKEIENLKIGLETAVDGRIYEKVLNSSLEKDILINNLNCEIKETQLRLSQLINQPLELININNELQTPNPKRQYNKKPKELL